MRFTSEQRLDDGVLERAFTLGEIPGVLWTPGSASVPAPLILLGQPIDDEIVDRLVLPLVEKAVPERRAALDALLSLPEIGGPVGYAGGVIAIGIRRAVARSALAVVAGSRSEGVECSPFR